MTQKDNTTKTTEPVPNAAATETEAITCGIVMPISAINECTADHWQEIREILEEVIIKDLKITAHMVSEADDSGIIQQRIIQNLYNNEIVICDVSGKNPNVMFELGIRLAFDKPTIIIKDDCTDYSFDTGIIEHLCYPRDLAYWKILKFKKALKDKILSTLDKAQKDPEYSTFLKNFGEFKVGKLKTKTVSKDEYILASLDELKCEVARIVRLTVNPRPRPIIGRDLPSQTMRCFQLIGERIETYLAKRKDLSVPDLYNDSNEFENVIEYLEASKVLREICETRDSLKQLTRRQLERMIEKEVNALL